MWHHPARVPLVGMGCMRLSTALDRDERHAIAVLHAAFDAGVTFLDTADAYCWNDKETGHNERLIARAIATWNGDRSRITVATKGGITRPQGQWIADGRARHLVAACDASRRALGLDRIPLYQLHAVDPRTSLTTSVRALARLKRDGAVDAIGLCNVNVGQIEQARSIADIAAVQVELSLWRDDNLLNGVVDYCITHHIHLIAYRPLGGVERRRKLADPVLVDLARRHDTTPAAIALAWLTELSDVVIPIPGPTRVETAAATGRTRMIRFTAADRARLNERFPSGRALRQAAASSDQHAAAPVEGEVVLIMGLPAAGKSTIARTFVEQGYARLNRDEGGGSLRGLLPALDRVVAEGCTRVVLDNTYVSRESRASVVQAAARHGLRVRCVWLSTSIEDAQVNAASRILSKFGRLLGPDEIRQTSKRDVSVFGPMVQFRYQRELEPPSPAEGFSAIEAVAFSRRRDASQTNRAVIVWWDALANQRAQHSTDTAQILTERGDVLRRYAADGWQLFALSWQPGIAEGTITAEQEEARFNDVRNALGVSIDVLYCPHGGGPPVCWCRKPLPGLGVVLIQRHQLDPAQCIYVGNGPQDPGFARRLGFTYRDAAEFFGRL